MALFVRDNGPRLHKGFIENQMYTVGKKPLKLIIGLGNVGKQYEKTRHNAGFIMLDEFRAKYLETDWSMMSLILNLVAFAFGLVAVLLDKMALKMSQELLVNLIGGLG